MSSASRKPGGAAPAGEASDIWAAARAGDLGAIERHLASGAAVDGVDPERGGTPLLWAAVTGRAEAIELLIRRGADVNAVDRDGGTALHAAAFLGHEKAVDVLVRNGAKVNATNNRGETPLDGAVLDEGTTRYFASLLQLELNEDGLGRRKAAIAESLRQRGATAGRKSGVADLLMQMPLFNHLWFLWFLWWLVLGYAAVSALGSRLPSIRLPAWLVLSPARYLWLIPLTMIPQWFMGDGGTSPIFGPDTSTGLLPIPHVLAYYAIFFGFGALYFGSDDRSGRVGERWWLPLSIGLLVVLPLGMALAEGWTGPRGRTGSARCRAESSRVVLQAAYPWLMTFGLMGLFRRVCPAESPTMRYLSDSAYWLYLAHLPLIIAAQYRGAGLADPGPREVPAHRRGRDLLPAVDVPGPGALHLAGAIPERPAHPARPGRFARGRRLTPCHSGALCVEGDDQDRRGGDGADEAEAPAHGPDGVGGEDGASSGHARAPPGRVIRTVNLLPITAPRPCRRRPGSASDSFPGATPFPAYETMSARDLRSVADDDDDERAGDVAPPAALGLGAGRRRGRRRGWRPRGRGDASWGRAPSSGRSPGSGSSRRP